MRFLDRRQRRIFVYGQPADLRKGFNGLEGLVRYYLDEDPLSGDIFIFINRRRSHLKCLLWDRTGFVIVAKRLERGKFRLRASEPKLELNEQRLALLFDGVAVAGLEVREEVSENLPAQPVKA